METSEDIELALGIDELRGRFLEHSRRAYEALPRQSGPRILDIGCGRGLQTMELARLGGGDVIGIDVDAAVLAILQRRIDTAKLGHRVSARHVSLFDNGFADGQFDLLWEEGVLHLLETARSLSECNRLLKPRGHLVMHETTEWFENTDADLREAGFETVHEYLLPRDFWWTDYGAPLEERIQAYRAARGDAVELAVYENQVAAIKKDPDRTACGIRVARKIP